MHLGTKLTAIFVLLGNFTVAHAITSLEKTQLEQLMPDVIEQASKDSWQPDVVQHIPANTQQNLLSIFKTNQPNDIVSGYGQITSVTPEQLINMTIYWTLTNEDTQVDHATDVHLSLDLNHGDWIIKQFVLKTDRIIGQTQLRAQRFEHCR